MIKWVRVREVYCTHFVTFGPGFIIIFNFSALSTVNTMSNCVCAMCVCRLVANTKTLNDIFSCGVNINCVCVCVLTGRTGWYHYDHSVEQVSGGGTFRIFIQRFQSFYFEFNFIKLNDFYLVCQSEEDKNKKEFLSFCLICWSLRCSWVHWIISYCTIHLKILRGTNRSNQIALNCSVVNCGFGWYQFFVVSGYFPFISYKWKQQFLPRTIFFFWNWNFDLWILLLLFIGFCDSYFVIYYMKTVSYPLKILPRRKMQIID